MSRIHSWRDRVIDSSVLSLQWAGAAVIATGISQANTTNSFLATLVIAIFTIGMGIIVAIFIQPILREAQREFLVEPIIEEFPEDSEVAEKERDQHDGQANHSPYSRTRKYQRYT